MSSDLLFDIHAAGVKRHPRSWLGANEAAIHAAIEHNFDYTTQENKMLLSKVVLCILDNMEAP